MDDKAKLSDIGNPGLGVVGGSNNDRTWGSRPSFIYGNGCFAGVYIGSFPCIRTGCNFINGDIVKFSGTGIIDFSYGLALWLGLIWNRFYDKTRGCTVLNEFH